MNPLIYTQDDLQSAFAIAEAGAMVKALRKLINRHGFPKPLPGMQCRWPKAAVDEWLVNHGALPPHKPSRDNVLANDNTVIMASTSLTKLLERAYATT